jgi:hypothetical protein
MRSPNTVTSTAGIFPLGSQQSSDPCANLLCAAEVHILYFRGLPLQIKVRHQKQEYRCSLPQRFQDAFARVVKRIKTNGKSECKWSFFGYRHGTLKQVAELIIGEFEASIDNNLLEQWEQKLTQDREITFAHLLFSLAMLRSPVEKNYLS